jgi:hypothetical protein
MYTAKLAGGSWANTLAFGQRQGSGGGPTLDAWLLESDWRPNDRWTLLARAERVANDELTIGLLEGPVYEVSRISAGAIRDWRVAKHVKLGLGALYDFDFVPQALATSYGSSTPHGAMGFVRLKLD